MSSALPPLPRWADLVLLPALNLMLAFFVVGVIVWLIGENPFEALGVMIQGAFFYPDSLGNTLYYTTNFVFTGLAVGISFQALMFNIGGEGQAYLGGLGAFVGAALFAPFLPGLLAIPLVILFAAAFGAAWAFVPGYLQAKRDSHIVITTIMFNFLAFSLMIWLLSGPLIQPGQQSPQTVLIGEHIWLPRMHEMAAWFGLKWARSPLNASFFIALIAMAVYYHIVWRTKLGYEIRAVGKNQAAAKYAGINVPRVIIITLALSGAFAGLMATNEVMGVQHRVINGFSAGYGFTGIAVALMGRNHPIGIFLAALLFGALFQGGTELDFVYSTITREMVLLIQGMIILFSGALAYMLYNPLAWVFATASRQEGDA